MYEIHMRNRFKGVTGKFLLYLALIPLGLGLAIPLFLAGVGLGAFVTYSRDLPEVPGLSYQPKTVSTFYADDGSVIGIFYKEKRYVVDTAQIPQHTINAFLAAEDSRFFEHGGVDWIRIVGAAFRNLRAGRITQGGSTITMQVTRNFLLTRERSFSRKMKEVALASKLEKAWGKQKILHVYLNEIYLGEGCYGVEAAARGYFDKPVEHLSIAESAQLAGLVAGPARFNPFKNEDLARQKELTVLGRMLRFGFINQDEYDKAKEEPLVFRKEHVRPFDLAPDFTEAVRRYIVRHYGAEKLYNEGLKVFTTCKIDYQTKAVESLEKGIEEIKRRQKNPAILKTVQKDEIPGLLVKRANITELVPDKTYQGVVTKVHRRKQEILVEVALNKSTSGFVHLEPTQTSYRVGHVLALRFTEFSGERPIFVLDNDPKLQGAVVSIENKTGYVRALVGGVPGDKFKFNRAIQGQRQPGSAFKPLIYAVALESASYSPATIIIDEPITVDFDKEDVEWEPRNSGGNFLGPLSFRRALELSRNICTIKILMDLGFDPVIDLARRMGLTSDLGRNLSLSLGTSEVHVLEMTSAYTVFANSGVWIEPVLIKRIEDRFGNVLENNEELPMLDESEIPRPRPREEFANMGGFSEPIRKRVSSEKNKNDVSEAGDDTVQPDGEPIKEPRKIRAALSPQTAYIMTSLLQGGVREGTGARTHNYVKRRDLAGKTGTTNQAADAWFIGFNPDYTTGVWVGFDEKRPLGGREEGARAALPVWGYLMNYILDKKPERDFVVPPDITFKDALTFTGTSSTGFTPKMVREPFYTPFIGQTLVLSPLDTPELLAQYRGVLAPNLMVDQNSPVNQNGLNNPSGNTGSAHMRNYPTPPPTPLHPMDGRNLFPETTAPRVGPAPTYAPPGTPTERPQNMSYKPGDGRSSAAPATKLRDVRSPELRVDSTGKVIDLEKKPPTVGVPGHR